MVIQETLRNRYFGGEIWVFTLKVLYYYCIFLIRPSVMSWRHEWAIIVGRYEYFGKVFGLPVANLPYSGPIEPSSIPDCEVIAKHSPLDSPRCTSGRSSLPDSLLHVLSGCRASPPANYGISPSID